jgi:tetratricopeptide (TPR) repeat protein
MLRRNDRLSVLAFLPFFLAPLCGAQDQPKTPQDQSKTSVTVPVTNLPKLLPSDAQYAKEGVVYEKIATVIHYGADGLGDKTLTVEARIQSEGAVHEAGLLSFAYASGEEHLEPVYVRVRKPDGTVVSTPTADIQDMPTEVTREAPFYSDLREIQIPVKSLSPGDKLEYQMKYVGQKSAAPGQFWGATNFVRGAAVVLDETVELAFPKDKYALVLSPKDKPVITEENGLKVYRWKTSQLDPTVTDEKKKEEKPYDPDELASVTWTTFKSWQEVGDWYGKLAKDRAVPSDEVQEKVKQLIQGKTTDDEKIEAIYHYVSTQVRYIGVAFGVGRYQPHSAETVLDNQYGDCKDKHTLLAAMLKAAGYDAWPALIGSSVKLHEDLPSPSQFDHVITVVPLKGQVIWLDSTPEVTPYRLLMAPLRDKQALVIPTGEAPKLMRTPVDGPFPFVDMATATGKLDSQGTLDGHIDMEMRGDTEATFREIFHGTSRSRWPEMAQNISQRMGFAGTVTNLDVSLPEQTEKPFHYAYDYNRKEYADWSNRRILPLVTAVGLSMLGDDEKPTKPIELGSPRVETHHSVIELPSNYTAELPRSVKYTTPFAVYEADYKLDGNKLVTERKLEITKREVAAAQAEEYRKFTKNVTDDENQFIQLAAAGSTGIDTSAGNPEAAQFLQAAYVDLTRHDLKAAHSDLHSAEQLNPKERGLWREYAYVDMLENRIDDSVTDLRKEIQNHPEDAVSYQALAEQQVRMKRLDDAEQTLRNLLKVIPDNTNAEMQLSGLLILQKKYDESREVMETAAKQAPDNRNVAVQAGRAELLAGKRDAGVEMLKKSLDGADDPGTENDAAYELADFNADLPTAETNSRKAIETLEKQTAQMTLGNLSKEDLQHINLLTAVWDTMGWVYFREGKLADAENYIGTAWRVTQHSEVGDHLGQIYEKQGKLADAVNIYNLSLAAATLSPDPSGTESIRASVDRLKAKGVAADVSDANEKLAQMRTVAMPKVVKSGTADFFVLLSTDKIEDAQFITGDESLRSAMAELMKASFSGEIPKGSTAKIVRRGILYCSETPDKCQFTMLLPQSVSID